MALSLLAIAGCGPANPYDSLYQAQQAKDGAYWRTSFAKGYFPPSFGEPKMEYSCNSDRPAPIIGEVESDWYPRQWQAAKEASFYRLSEQKRPPAFALRFSYIPSFQPSIFIRVDKEGNDYRLIAKQMNGAGGYDPGTIARSMEMRLSKPQAAELERLLANGKFFDQPPVDCIQGFDGDKWIFELASKTGYKMVKRWSPDKGAALDLGEYLVELSGFDFAP
jgi:hypothetical protein